MAPITSTVGVNPGTQRHARAASGPPASRLAVILHADVVGSTRLVLRDERLAHQRIQGVLQRLCATVAQYGGAARELRGDAVVAEFGRAGDAIAAAVAFQSSSALLNATRIGHIEPQLRIGIALGDVVVANGTLTGAVVVLAQRIEQLAGAGEIYLQGAVYDALSHAMPLRYAEKGEHRLTGFEHPVRVVSVARADAVPQPPVAPRRATRPLPARHVLSAVPSAAAALMLGLMLGLSAPLS